MDTAVLVSNIIHDPQAAASDGEKTMYFHVLCTFELLLQDQDGTSSLLKRNAVSAVSQAGFSSPSLLLIIFSVACVCLDGGGVSTAMHTLSGLLTGTENYLASLEIF